MPGSEKKSTPEAPTPMAVSKLSRRLRRAVIDCALPGRGMSMPRLVPLPSRVTSIVLAIICPRQTEWRVAATLASIS